MADLLRHIGKTSNTDRRVVVVYMQIPGREDHALVVDTDSLPHKYHDDLMQVIQGEAQKEPVLANILSRRIMPSTGLDMLTSLHQAGQLQALPIEKIIMLPQPNRPVPLSKLVEFMGKNEVQAKEIEENQFRDNRVVENQAIEKDNSVYNIANNLLIEANMLQSEADRKRKQAYEMYPNLRPVAPSPASYTVDTTGVSDDKAKELLDATKKTVAKTRKTTKKPTSE